ncbi:MAG: bifunctional diaminohydroxyphosphoribosylaminopyrimidine deaminase/5-amino-6-(5-phosphoribosylamino)uracil reductase RibD [Thermoguttaceae bacterium]
MNPYMRRALELAQLGGDAVSPNPQVGCVIVQNNQIVGEGHHAYFGGPHAEMNALKKAGHLAKGGTVYVTLEPCSHFGKTPPCSQALIAAEISKVYVGMRDPNPLVSGRGIVQLQEAGIEVIELPENAAIRAINAPFIVWMEEQRPWICAKWAMTLDGKIATRTGSSQWISSNLARLLVHRLRAKMDAIIIGSGTAQVDNPSLTVRHRPTPEMGLTDEQLGLLETLVPLRASNSLSRPLSQPLRVVLDSSASLRLDSQLVQTAKECPVLIGVGPHAPREKMQALQDQGCDILALPERGSSEDQLGLLVRTLYHRGVRRVMIEGGGELLGSFFDQHLIDEVHVFVAPKIIGGQSAISPIKGLGVAEMSDAFEIESPNVHFLDPDIYLRGTKQAPSERPNV